MQILHESREEIGTWWLSVLDWPPEDEVEKGAAKKLIEQNVRPYRQQIERLEMEAKGYTHMTLKELIEWYRNKRTPRERMQVEKRQNRYTYTDGPMYYLGQQIVKAMEDAGYPAKIFCCLRTPQEQNEVFQKGHSKARAWHSPHQFYEAVDIIHPSKAWDVSSDYWEALATCVRTIAERYDVNLEHGHYWSFTDSAHIQLKDWKVAREIVRQRWRDEQDEWRQMRHEDPLIVLPMPEPTPPTPYELAARFESVLPSVWRQRPDARI